MDFKWPWNCPSQIATDTEIIPIKWSIPNPLLLYQIQSIRLVPEIRSIKNKGRNTQPIPPQFMKRTFQKTLNNVSPIWRPTPPKTDNLFQIYNDSPQSPEKSQEDTPLPQIRTRFQKRIRLTSLSWSFEKDTTFAQQVEFTFHCYNFPPNTRFMRLFIRMTFYISRMMTVIASTSIGRFSSRQRIRQVSSPTQIRLRVLRDGTYYLALRISAKLWVVRWR